MAVLFFVFKLGQMNATGIVPLNFGDCNSATEILLFRPAIVSFQMLTTLQLDLAIGFSHSIADIVAC